MAVVEMKLVPCWIFVWIISDGRVSLNLPWQLFPPLPPKLQEDIIYMSIKVPTAVEYPLLLYVSLSH